MRSCKLFSGAALPVLGLGTWRMGESPRQRAEELDAIKYGLDLGYPMIDAYLAGRDPGHPIHALTEFLNSQAFIGFCSAGICTPGR